jgi:hypothetical protein
MMHPRIAQSQVPLRTEQVDEMLVATVMQGAGFMELRSRILMLNVWIFLIFSLHYHSTIIPF